MTGFWIRVNARLADDADVRAFARIILPDLPAWIAVEAACGLLVTLWGRIIDEQEDGDVSGRDDDALEEWAKWRGAPGLFASAFRATFTREGRVRGWLEYQGPLIARRERDRERKRLRAEERLRAESDAIPRDPHADVGERSRRNGDGNGNEQRTTQQPSSPAPPAVEFKPVEAVLDRIAVGSRPAWAAAIAVARDGTPGRPPLTAAQVDQACTDFLGNGGLEGRPSLAYFRGYLAKSGQPRLSRGPPHSARPTKQETARAHLSAWVIESEDNSNGK